jgi:hypothetical protein
MSSTTTTIKIIASRFKGIPKDELDELFKIAEQISSYNKRYDDYETIDLTEDLKEISSLYITKKSSQTDKAK